MAYDVPDFKTLIDLESHGPDVFVGVSPKYDWGSVYGGQAVAQALRAAGATVDDGYFVHSLHAYFIRRGDLNEPIRFEVDRIRNGRSFITRRVVCRQSMGPILNLSASFQCREEEADVQEDSMPADVPAPETLTPLATCPFLWRHEIPTAGAMVRAWLRVEGMGPERDDERVQACALAYASDDVATEVARRSHPLVANSNESRKYYREKFMGASLDHSIWFHRPARHDEFVLHDFYGHGLAGSRGLAIGQIYSQTGLHIATVAQQTLLRERKN